MTPLATIRGLVVSALGAASDALAPFADIRRTVDGLDVPATGAPPATPTTQEPLTATTVAALRAMLDEHDRGFFLRSALLADLLRRDADVFGALQQRLLKLQSAPLRFTPADVTAENAAALAAAADLARRWATICPAAVQSDLAVDAYMMGFAWAQLVYTHDAETGRLTQTLDPWPAWAVEYVRLERRWYAYTLDRGRIPITPGDGQWVLYAPRSKRAPYLWGAIRPVAEWSLRTSYSASDASRLAEVQGNAIMKAKLPAGARETPDGKAFMRALRTMGRNAVVPIPQGQNAAESYDIELVQAHVDTYRIFEFLMRTAGGRIRLAILGQDLTSQNQSVGSKGTSETGENVLDDLVESDARGLSETYTAQVAAHDARYLGTPPVTVTVDAEPEEDLARTAETQGKAAEAAAKWLALVPDTDLDALAEMARIPRKAATKEPT